MIIQYGGQSFAFPPCLRSHHSSPLSILGFCRILSHAPLGIWLLSFCMMILRFSACLAHLLINIFKFHGYTTVPLFIQLQMDLSYVCFVHIIEKALMNSLMFGSFKELSIFISLQCIPLSRLSRL